MEGIVVFGIVRIGMEGVEVVVVVGVVGVVVNGVGRTGRRTLDRGYLRRNETEEVRRTRR